MEKRSVRQSGVELLRILTMLGVVLLHYNSGKALTCVQSGANFYVLLLLESLCVCAVDLFILISGYFLSGSQKRSYLKPLELVVQLILFKELIYILEVVFGQTDFSIRTAVARLIPNNYFIILYITLYLISPYLNRVFVSFSKQQWTRFLIIIVLLFSVWPTFVDLFEEFVGQEWNGLSTITAQGSQQGFNIVNFVLLYFVGAYLRFNDAPKILKSKSRYVVAIAIAVLLIFAWAVATQGLTRFELRSAWMYHNTLVILLAALLFLLFKSFSFKSKSVNELAKASFTCFLLHEFLLRFAKIEMFCTANVFLMLGHILVVTISCYLISYVVFKVYNLATGWFFKVLSEKISFLQTREDI